MTERDHPIKIQNTEKKHSTERTDSDREIIQLKYRTLRKSTARRDLTVTEREIGAV